MPDIQDICEQIDQVGLHQLITLDLSTQSLRQRLTDELSLEEALAITHTLAALNAQMLQWVRVLLGGEEPEAAHECAACREGEGEED